PLCFCAIFPTPPAPASSSLSLHDALPICLGVTACAASYNDRTTGRGMAVGNLISQLSANVYMNALDQHMKHTMRTKYYARYMDEDRKSTRLNSSHVSISYAVFCLKKKKTQ